jgi:hypothetical protein
LVLLLLGAGRRFFYPTHLRRQSFGTDLETLALPWSPGLRRSASDA